MELPGLATDIVGLWDKLEINRSHYVGKALNGMAGYELALKYKWLSQSLTLVVTQGRIPEGNLERMRRNVSDFEKKWFSG